VLIKEQIKKLLDHIKPHSDKTTLNTIKYMQQKLKRIV